MRIILKWLFFYSCVSIVNLHASFEDHFKKVEAKSNFCRMAGIDSIYVINLDERPERYERTMQVLAPYGIYPHRFSAVNGWKLSFEALEELGIVPQEKTEGPLCTVYRHEGEEEYTSQEIMEEVGVSYFSHGLRRGPIGIILS